MQCVLPVEAYVLIHHQNQHCYIVCYIYACMIVEAVGMPSVPVE